MKRAKTGKASSKSGVEPKQALICAWLVRAGIFLTLLVPLVVKPDLYYPFASTKGLWFMGTVQLTFAVWTWLALVDHRYRPGVSIVLIALSAYLLSVTVSAILGPDPTLSFWSKYERLAGVIAHFHLFAFFLILSSFLKEEKEWQRMFSVSIAIASIVSVWGLAQNHGFWPVLRAFDAFHLVSAKVAEITKGGSTLGNTSFLGSYLQLNAFLSIYMVAKSKGRVRVAIVGALILICLAIFLNPGGRAMRISFVVGALLIALLYFAFKSERGTVRMSARLLLFSAIPAFIYLAVAALSAGSYINERVMAVRGMDVRIRNLKIAWEGICERPLMGWGFENYELVFYRYFDPEVLVGTGRTVQQSWFDRVHNIVLDLLVTAGFVGFGIFCVTVTVSIFVLWREYFRNREVGIAGCLVFTAMFAAHFIQNLSVFDMLPSYMLLFVVFAYAAAKSRPVKIPGLKIFELRPTGPLPVVVLVGIVMMSGTAFYNFVYKPYRVAVLVSELAPGNPGGSEEGRYVVASESTPVGRHQVRFQLAESAIKRLKVVENMERDHLYFSDSDYVISQLEKSVEESPMNFRVLYTLGQLNADVAFRISVNDKTQAHGGKALDYIIASESAYQKAIDLSPENVLAYWGLSRALIYKGFILNDTGFHKSALVLAEQAVMIEPKVFASHDLVVDIAANLVGDRDLALRKVAEAESIDARWKGKLMDHVRNVQAGRNKE